MNDLDRLLAERACERLLVSYTHHIDVGEPTKVADLFVEDGVWESPEGAQKGREAIHRFFADAAMLGSVKRHVNTNVAITITDADHGEGLSYFLLFRDTSGRRIPDLADQPTIVGEYRDRYVRVDGDWRFARRTAGVAMVRRRAGGS